MTFMLTEQSDLGRRAGSVHGVQSAQVSRTFRSVTLVAMSAGLARTASRLAVAVRRTRCTASWRSDSVRCTRFQSLRGVSTVPDARELIARSPAAPPESAAPATPVLSAAPGTSREFSPSAELDPIPTSESVHVGSRSVVPDGTAGIGAPLQILGESTPERAANVVDAAAGAAVTTDVAAVAQVAETAAATGFSLSDTLLQPAMFLLHTVHDYSGLPWWMAIGVATFAVRTAILPLSVITMRNSARMAALQGEIGARREEVMEAMRSGDRAKAGEKQEAMKKFMNDAGVGPSKVLMGPLVQFPIFISFFVAVRRLALSDPSMTSGGAAWFTDLSVSDPTFMLPILSGLSLAAMTELGGDTGTTKVTPMMKNVLRGMAVCSVPLTYWFAAGVFCYWLPNNIYSVAFSLAMRSKPLKAALGMNVDLATIPGTKAFERAQKDAALNPPISAPDLTAASAAASYVKKIDPLNVDTTSTIKPVVHEVQGKPVLLKHRPKKKRAKGRA